MWRMGRLGFTKMFAIVYAIVKGLSYKALAEHIGININKNTYTKYGRDVGLVVGEALEKDRKTWGCKFRNAQSDEVSFRGRKHCKGRRVRNRGIQWGLTIVEVDEVTKKTTAVDLQFLPYNCKSDNPTYCSKDDARRPCLQIAGVHTEQQRRQLKSHTSH